MKIRTLLVDDEIPARLRLRGMLEPIEDLEIVGEAGDGVEAVERIAATRPDLVFLDIEMPGMNGMEVAAVLSPPRPTVVFCTAYDQYAIEAFEHHATDYLLKPVNRARLEATVDRVRQTLRGQLELRREMDDASRTQERLMPRCPPGLETLDYTGTCIPARGIGGDLYDFLPLGDGAVGLTLADVSGKGVFAGLLMAGLQGRIQAIAPGYAGTLGEMIGEINRQTHASIEPNRYATLFYGRYDDRTRELTYVNAGHLPPIVLRGADDEVLPLAATGTVVGMLPDVRYREERLTLMPGDRICIYTDGLTETVDQDGREFGFDRLVASMKQNAGLAAERLAEAILAEVRRFACGAEPVDDLTLIVGQVR